MASAPVRPGTDECTDRLSGVDGAATRSAAKPRWRPNILAKGWVEEITLIEIESTLCDGQRKENCFKRTHVEYPSTNKLGTKIMESIIVNMLMQ